MVPNPKIRTIGLLIAIIGISILESYCIMQRSYLGVLVATSILIGLCTRIVRQQQQTTRMFNRMLEDLKFRDFSLHYSCQGKSKEEQHMAAKINGVIEELKHIHLNYEEQTHYYKTLLNTIDSCIVVCDPSGKVVWLNRCAEIQICGHPFHSLHELSQVDTKFPTLLMSIKPGEIKSIRTYRDDIAIDWAITVTEYLKKGVYYKLFHLRNIRSLLEENEMEAWQKLVRVLTHEIMNSIAPIISLSETLVDYLPTEETQSGEHTAEPINIQDEDKNLKVSEPCEEDDDDDSEEENSNQQILQQGLQAIHRRSKGLLEFVENYRKLTRITSPQLSSVPAKELLDDLQKLFADLPIEIHYEHSGCMLMIDRTQIEQVLINLIKNAKEACEDEPHPQISIHTHYDEDIEIFLLSVTDNGKGILPEVQDRIFVPFFTTKPSGSGIGLSICKQIMMLHGGTISVVSIPGKHTTFTLKFVNVQTHLHRQ